MSDRALALHRKTRCVELRLAGLDYETIAAEVGYTSKATAWHTVNDALNERKVAAVDELRATELARLDRMQFGLWEAATAGDTKAVDSVLKIMNHRSKLLGLETAVQEGVMTPRTVVIQGNSEEYIRGLKMVDGIGDA